LYKGTWEDKIIRGKGSFTYPSGTILEAEFKNINETSSSAKVINPIQSTD
jgi:hypothetical protein